VSESPRPNGNRQPTVYELLREIDKRYEAQFKGQSDALIAADKRYEQRFIAQEQALQTALIGQDKAVNAALAAAKEAVSKSELAAEKRFDSFTATLTEKLDSLMKDRDTGAGKGLASREMFAWLVGAASIAYVVIRIATGH
jgi:hypothetical protein